MAARRSWFIPDPDVVRVIGVIEIIGDVIRVGTGNVWVFGFWLDFVDIRIAPFDILPAICPGARRLGSIGGLASGRSILGDVGFSFRGSLAVLR